MRTLNVKRPLAIACGIALSLNLAACGGGGETTAETTHGATGRSATTSPGTGSAPGSGTPDDRTRLSTQAGRIAGTPALAASIIDLALRAAALAQHAQAQAITDDGRARALATVDGRVEALAITLPALSLACPGGGSASMVISGASLPSLLNARPDTGETYRLGLQSCRIVDQAPPLDGTLTLDVGTADALSFAARAELSGLSALVGNERLSLQGQTSLDVTTAQDAEATYQTSRLQSARLGLTVAGSSEASIELNGLDLTLKTSLRGSSLRTDALQGRYTLLMRSSGSSFSSSIETRGEVSFSPVGQPTTGGWWIDLGSTRLGLGIRGDQADLSVDIGNDGSTELAFQVPLAWIFPARSS